MNKNPDHKVRGRNGRPKNHIPMWFAEYKNLNGSKERYVYVGKKLKRAEDVKNLDHFCEENNIVNPYLDLSNNVGSPLLKNAINQTKLTGTGLSKLEEFIKNEFNITIDINMFEPSFLKDDNPVDTHETPIIDDDIMNPFGFYKNKVIPQITPFNEEEQLSENDMPSFFN